jgi:hypothetical protein
MVNKKVADALKNKLDDIKYEQNIDKNNVRIINRVVFYDNDNYYFYVFNIVLKDTIIKKYRANTIEEYDKIYDELVQEYNTNVECKYDDLNYNQLCILDEQYNNNDLDVRLNIDRIKKDKSILFFDNIDASIVGDTI